MIKKYLNSTIMMLMPRFLLEYDDRIIQVEPINYVYYAGSKQFSETRFLCEVKMEKESERS